MRNLAVCVFGLVALTACGHDTPGAGADATETSGEGDGDGDGDGECVPDGGEYCEHNGLPCCEGLYCVTHPDGYDNHTICSDVPGDGDGDGDGEIADVAAGIAHTCVVVDHGLRCWGSNERGQLGTGVAGNIGDDEPASKSLGVDLGGPISAVFAGAVTTCALRENGSVYCWGDGLDGKLGYGNTESIGDDETAGTVGPVDVGGPVSQLALSDEHTCALLDKGTVRCWGIGQNGRLGYGNIDSVGDDEVPSAAGDVDVGGTVSQIAVGWQHTCAVLLEGGKLRCWGANAAGQLGYGNIETIGDDEAPTTAGDVDVGGAVTQVVGGSTHTCALLAGGTVRCWGDGPLGLANNDVIGDDEAPSAAPTVDVGGTVVELATQQDHVCALLDDNNVRCWGDAGAGQLGYGNTDDIGDDEAPSVAGSVNIGIEANYLAVGDRHTCVVAADATVRCWGDAQFGQLGYGNTQNVGDNETPASVGPVPLN